MTRRDPALLAELAQKVLYHRERRLEREAKTPPTILAAQRARRDAIRPRAETLMSEFGLNPPEAWLIAHDDQAWFGHVKRQELVKAAETSPGRNPSDPYSDRYKPLEAGQVQADKRTVQASEKSPSRAQSSIALINPVRRGPTIPDPSIKPGETPKQAAARIKKHIAGLGQASPQARPLDESRDVGFSEKSEEAYAALKAAELVSHGAMVREVAHQATTAGAVTLSESKTVQDRALAVMRAKDQSTKPHSKNFAENYAAALRSLEGVR